jgi:hypothetical protein
MQDSDDLDFIINRAVASYGDPAADQQLAERLLDGVRQRTPVTHPPAHRRWLPWAAGLAAAACALAVIFGTLWPKHAPINSPGKQQSGQSMAASAPAPSPPLARSAPSNRTQRSNLPRRMKQPRHGMTNNAARPKLDVFPTAEPLSDENQAFALFVQRAPPSQVRELLTAQTSADAPVTIEELKIQPLTPLDDGGR